MFKLFRKKKNITVDEETDMVEYVNHVVRVNALLYRDRGYVVGDVVRVTIHKDELLSVFEGRIAEIFSTMITLDSSSMFCANRYELHIREIVSIEPLEEEK